MLRNRLPSRRSIPLRHTPAALRTIHDVLDAHRVPLGPLGQLRVGVDRHGVACGGCAKHAGRMQLEPLGALDRRLMATAVWCPSSPADTAALGHRSAVLEVLDTVWSALDQPAGSDARTQTLALFEARRRLRASARRCGRPDVARWARRLGRDLTVEALALAAVAEADSYLP